ncbi:hypothetical protein CPB85DRAFT_73311 [Mucidula mucida]|nr:hypothetical protein CPB85DRAFT_73311 [Mucidula mucida]
MTSPGKDLPEIPSDISLITGPTMIAICLNWGLMGVLLVQIFFYHVSFPKDSVTIKSLVYGLFVLDILQTALVTADAFHWFVFGFGDMNRLDDTFLNSWDVPLLDSVIALIVQCFYSWRIYVLQKSAIFPVLIVLVSLCQCGAGVAVAIIAHRLGKLSLISTEVAEQTTWLAASALADVLITIVLSWTLLRSRSSFLPVSGRRIGRIVALTVETNCLTAGVAVISLILFLGVPQHSTLVVPPTAIIAKLYTNCLVAVLNNRSLGSGTRFGTSTGSSNFQSFRMPELPSAAARRDQMLKVEVIQQTDTRDDDGIALRDFGKSQFSTQRGSNSF